MPVNILVADDEKAMISLYLRIFAGTGYTITTAETFSEAADLIQENNFDLLVTDFIFPDGVGTELIKLFNERKAGAKSLLVTGTPDAKEKLAEQGMYDYIEKPFRMELLLAAVNKALA